jgi:dienelactone hydrolase
LISDLAQAAGGDVELHVYPDVGHAFMTGFTSEGISNMETIGCPVRRASLLLIVCQPVHESTGGPAHRLYGLLPLNLQRPDNIQEVQQEAWSRLIAFFDKHLKD